MSPKFRQLAEAEILWLSQKGDRVNALLAQHGLDPAGTGLDHEIADLERLQKLFDAAHFTADDTDDLLAIGTALGQIFAANTIMEWQVVASSLGVSLALKHPKHDLIIYPITMISKRVHEEREVDIPGLYWTIVSNMKLAAP